MKSVPLATSNSRTLPIVSGETAVRFAAPQWAAIFALVNGARGAAIGAAGPNLYALANRTLAQSSPAFNDITIGLNGYYHAGADWDYVTGWGSPQVWNLVQDLM